MFLFFIPLHIAVIIVFMRLIARKEADFDLPKCALVFGPTFALLHLAGAALGPPALALYFLGPFAALGFFFSVPWHKAAAIAGCFLLYIFAYALLINMASK